ncbi:hypothetical protein GCM10027070_06640 [Barrientosiimonas humi]
MDSRARPPGIVDTAMLPGRHESDGRLPSGRRPSAYPLPAALSCGHEALAAPYPAALTDSDINAANPSMVRGFLMGESAPPDRDPVT